MNNTLVIGKETIWLEEHESTNVYAQNLISLSNIIEGVVIVAKNQLSGKGQRGNKWLSEPGKNLTFSIILTPKLRVENQFLISKVVAIGLVSYLKHIGLSNAKIKWPNDIYVGNNKIAGVLIENTLRKNKISNSIVGIGFNVNQELFDKYLTNPTSLSVEMKTVFDLENVLNDVLIFIEQQYFLLLKQDFKKIDEAYLSDLFGLNETRRFEVEGKEQIAEVKGVAKNGKLQLKLNDGIKDFDLKEVKFLID